MACSAVTRHRRHRCRRESHRNIRRRERAQRENEDGCVFREREVNKEEEDNDVI